MDFENLSILCYTRYSQAPVHDSAREVHLNFGSKTLYRRWVFNIRLLRLTVEHNRKVMPLASFSIRALFALTSTKMDRLCRHELQ